MAERARAAGGWAVLVLLSWLALNCRSATSKQPSAGAGGLTDGPTRWLMLPDELRQAQRLRTTREAVDFIEAFWRRRDPDPDKPGNEFAKTFYERVEAADRLYAEGGTRGSLTDRGRALVLLGPPPVLRYSQRRAPSWEPGTPGTRPAIRARNVVLEIWVYPLTDMPPVFVQLLGEENPPAELTLTFLVGSRHTTLMEGEKYLETAARAAVREPPPAH
jgi:GWxTD domain-containing protein